MAQPDFTIADVLAWARTKPADEEYDFLDPGVCALGLFARERRGFSKRSAAHERYRGLVALELRNAVQGVGRGYGPERWTFGALVTRLEALLPAEPVSDTWTKADAYTAETVPA
jgi:hypothetical protein